jgi:hypothetical protein
MPEESKPIIGNFSDADADEKDAHADEKDATGGVNPPVRLTVKSMQI